MKNYTILFFICLLLLSCGKKTTMKGRIVNPVTNMGISGIKVIVTKPKKCLGYDGCGSKTIYETVSDENGYFLIEKRFRKSKSYTINYGYDKNNYTLVDAQVSPAGAEYDGSSFEFYLLPKGSLQRNIENANCFDENDLFSFQYIVRSDESLNSNGEYNGCFSNQGSNNRVVMGWKVIKGTVTKNNITTPYADSIYVTEGGYHIWNIEY